jgi:putative transposase
VLTRTYRRIGIEDFNVRGMARNHHLARFVMDGGFHEFRRQRECKAARTCGVVVAADRWFASSKSRSCCGMVKNMLDLSQRTIPLPCMWF